MGARRKLIVVSNRGPVSFDRDADGGRVARRGGGGLVTALRSLVAMHDVTWIASAMTDEDRVVAAEAGGDAIDETARDGSPYRLKLVAHEPTAYDWFYNVVANPTLWFLQHYLWNFAQAPNIDRGLHHAWEEGYVTVNAGFAEAVVAELEAEPGSPVFFHDYHLYLAPRFVRTRMPDAALSHFVHIPWPEPDYWRVLPEAIRRALHDGLLANDVVGFHTDHWRRNFLRSCADILGAECDFLDGAAEYDDRTIHATSRPISVDPAEFDELAGSDEVREREDELAPPDRAPRPPGRPDRPVEERRPRLPGVRAVSDRPSRVPREGGDARPPRPEPSGHSRVRRVSRRDPANGPRRQRSLPARGLDADRPSDRG